ARSGATVSIVSRLRVLDFREEILDACGVRDAFVRAEADLWGEAKPERLPDARPQMSGDTCEAVERRCAIGVAAHDADEHFRVAKIARDVDAGPRDHSRETRILRVLRQEGCDFLADRCGHLVRAAMICGHDRYEVVVDSSVRANSSVR